MFGGRGNIPPDADMPYAQREGEDPVRYLRLLPGGILLSGGVLKNAAHGMPVGSP